MIKKSLGSLTKEFPLADVEATLALIERGMRLGELKTAAAIHTKRDIPVLLVRRFLLVEGDSFVWDRLLSTASAEGFGSTRVRKIKYFVWVMREPRFRRFLLEVIADGKGRLDPNKLVDKSNAEFFTKFFQPSSALKARSNIERFFAESEILDVENREIDLDLGDNWLPDAVAITSQYESDLELSRQMLDDPISWVISSGFGALANATVDELRAHLPWRNRDHDAIDDYELDGDKDSPPSGKEWNRPPPSPSGSDGDLEMSVSIVKRESWFRSPSVGINDGRSSKRCWLQTSIQPAYRHVFRNRRRHGPRRNEELSGIQFPRSDTPRDKPDP